MSDDDKDDNCWIVEEQRHGMRWGLAYSKEEHTVFWTGYAWENSALKAARYPTKVAATFVARQVSKHAHAVAHVWFAAPQPAREEDK